MTERERLTELLNEATFGVNVHTLADHLKKETIEAVAGYLLSNGVIVPQVKVGDTVFIIDEGDEATESYVLDVVVTALRYDIAGFWITMRLPLGLKQSAHVGELSFDKTVFLTREEAEKVLKDGKADD